MSNDWFEQANCRDMDPNIFFPKRGQSLDPKADEACDTCTAHKSGECLEYALMNYVHGRWSKTSPRDRAALRRERKMSPSAPEPKWGTA